MLLPSIPPAPPWAGGTAVRSQSKSKKETENKLLPFIISFLNALLLKPRKRIGIHCIVACVVWCGLGYLSAEFLARKTWGDLWDTALEMPRHEQAFSQMLGITFAFAIAEVIAACLLAYLIRQLVRGLRKSNPRAACGSGESMLFRK
jgi:biotin transporter BioY